MRFYHDTLPPDVVTDALQVFPTKFHTVGQLRKSGGSKFGKSGWFLRSQDSVESRDVRKHIDWIIAKVKDRRSAVLELGRTGWRSDVFCFWEGIGQGGPMLNPEQMEALARLDLVCGFDIYQDWRMALDNPVPICP